MLDARAALGEWPDWDKERQREGGAVRFAPDGRLDTVVEPPVGPVMSCSFGGPNLCYLYITAASESLSQEQAAAQPHARRLFLRSRASGARPARVRRLSTCGSPV